MQTSNARRERGIAEENCSSVPKVCSDVEDGELSKV
jgi:hypothetical protein